MLDLIRQSRCIDIVSRLEKVIPTVEVKIDKVMEVLNK